MCGRYAVGNGPDIIGQRLRVEGLPVDQQPQEDEGNDDIRRHFNVAPGNHQLVYRAFPGAPEDAPQDDLPRQAGITYALEIMKWGLIPSWSTAPENYPGLLKTINCRSDSLAENKPLWSMKNNKRCIVVAIGFYEWLHKGKEKIPHFVKRVDGGLMLFAGLWDCVQYEGSQEKLYTYTIITTESNDQLSFLHERMPVILDPGEVQGWLSPKTKSWNPTLQSLLKPYTGALEVYPVTKDVGKVGRDSPSFIIPIDSAENKSNIKNFFITPKKGAKTKNTPKKELGDRDVEITGSSAGKPEKPESFGESPVRKSASTKKNPTENLATPRKTRSSNRNPNKGEDIPGPSSTSKTEYTPSKSPNASEMSTSASAKRERPEEGGDEELARKLARTNRPEEAGDEELARKLDMEERLMSSPLGARTRSATANTPKPTKKATPKKATTGKGKGEGKAGGSQKITSFFR